MQAPPSLGCMTKQRDKRPHLRYELITRKRDVITLVTKYVIKKVEA